MTSSIGDRIKAYERASNYQLVPRSCLFVRVDGRAFHTFTRGCEKPFDSMIMRAMTTAAMFTADEMQGFKIAYIQSDEATFMMTDFDSHETQGWFNYELNKVVSLSASIFTAYFNRYWSGHSDRTQAEKIATFDSRAFVVPIEDFPNVFVWRQRDWERNSLQMFARAHFSHKELDGKGHDEIHDMLHGKGLNWAKLTDEQKNGTFITPDKKFKHEKLDYEGVMNLYLEGIGSNSRMARG